jgi:hypothetical protein
MITERTVWRCNYNAPEARGYGNVKPIKRWEYGLLEIKHIQMINVKIKGTLITELRNF